MKRIILIIICLFFIKLSTKAVDYAILVSAGIATTDDVFSNSEYWYDLFLAYEDLVLNEGYAPANVFVFYGNGTSFNSTCARYQLALHGWGNIVDFDNAYNTLNTQFANIGAIVTNNDNLHIRWVVGHGGGDAATGNTAPYPSSTARDPINNDDYWVLLENRNLLVRETDIIRIINQVNNYKRRKIIWMTCHSGCLNGGTNNLNNNRTVLITASRWDEVSWPYWLPGETIHPELNYVVTSSLFGEDPSGTAYNADNNGDNVINMWELWNEANNSPIMHSDPQLGNNGNLANRIYIDEHLVIENTNINNDIQYLVDDYEFLNSSLQNGSDIEVDIDNGFEINGTFNAPIGTTLNIHP
jgi:hypothetical protein